MDQTFEQALKEFTRLSQERSWTHIGRGLPNPPQVLVYAEASRLKYARVVIYLHGQQHVFAFIRISDGAVLYPASYKKAYIAKSGPDSRQTVRGNIYDADHGLGCIGPYGVMTLR